jgi:hypothetical protein
LLNSSNRRRDWKRKRKRKKRKRKMKKSEKEMQGNIWKEIADFRVSLSVHSTDIDSNPLF